MRLKSRFESHAHSEFSNASLGFPDTTNKMNDLIKQAMLKGLTGIAITDHGSISGHVNAKLAIKKLKGDLSKKLDETNPSDFATIDKIKRLLDFKLVLGSEIYVTRDGLTRENVEKGEPFAHLIILAKNEKGLHQLRQISDRSWERSFSYGANRTPTWESDLVEMIGEQGHLVIQTACLGGPLGKLFDSFTSSKITKKELKEQALKIIKFYQNLVGEENFFLELQPALYDEQKAYNMFLLSLAKEYSVPYTIATDAHYISKEDRTIHKAFLRSKEGEREVDNFYKYAYLMTVDEVYNHMSYLPEEVITKGLQESINICKMCSEYEIEKTPMVPARPLEEKLEDIVFNSRFDKFYENRPYLKSIRESEDIQDRFFVRALEKGMVDRKIGENEYERHFDRLETEAEELVEISKILKDNMIKYPNLMQMVVDICWNEGNSLVGPSRGSAFGFLSHYLMGITNVSPFFHDEIPSPHWRFLSKERSAGLPDIDTDVESSKRKRILQALVNIYEKLGGDCVQVATFREEGSRSALATAARGLGYDHETAQYLSSLIINERGFNYSLSDMYYGDEEKGLKPSQQFIDEINKYPNLLETALSIEGLIVGRGVHACGIIITNEKITKYAARMKAPNGDFITQYNLDQCEYLGLVKFDLLSVEILTRQRFALDLLIKHGEIEDSGNLKENYEKVLGIDAIDLNDSNLWDIIKENKVNSLFQWDSPVGKQGIKAIQPNNIVELTVGNSLIRLQKQPNDPESPLETFVRYKNDINEWYSDMRSFGLTSDEMAPFIDYLKPKYGVAEDQESLMMLSMDTRVVGLTLGQADKLRKVVAKFLAS